MIDASGRILLRHAVCTWCGRPSWDHFPEGVVSESYRCGYCGRTQNEEPETYRQRLVRQFMGTLVRQFMGTKVDLFLLGLSYPGTLIAAGTNQGLIRLANSGVVTPFNYNEITGLSWDESHTVAGAK